MRLSITYVYFPEDRRDRIERRQIDEHMVHRALSAEDDLGDAPPILIEEWADWRGREMFVLGRDPESGRYLEIGFVLQSDGAARCYHARTMDDKQRRRFRAERWG
ncbi:MAG: hypothetical protein FJX74_20250 [Armatimonadetes bacterium]|nr:hypothetical protein [Armatimonadota bacterium]